MNKKWIERWNNPSFFLIPSKSSIFYNVKKEIFDYNEKRKGVISECLINY